MGSYSSISKKHPVLFNSILALIVFFLVWFVAYMLIDVFTNHGQEQQVPSVRNLSLAQAVDSLEAAGFNWEVSDSIYDSNVRPGTVVDQEPKGRAFAKKIRTVYLTINAFSPKMVNMPIINDISVRQALAILESMGFTHIVVDTVPSENGGLVSSVKVNGATIHPGSKVSIGDQVHLTVGDGKLPETPMEILPDNVIDSLQQIQRTKAEKERRERIARGEED